MSRFKSTMNCPLSADEEVRILVAWENLYCKSLEVEVDPEPEAMLDYCTDIIMRVWEVRRAISDGWYYANKRAAAPKAPKVRLFDLLDQVTEEQLVEAINTSLEPAPAHFEAPLKLTEDDDEA